MDEHRSDTELVAAATGGDARSYSALVRRHQQMAFRVAYAVTRSAADAEEAAQDGFVKAWRALDRFRPGADFRPWLLAIVRNEARNRVRSGGRRQRMNERLERQPTARFTAPADLAVLERAERDQINEAIDRLPGQLREILSCLYLLELSEVETAAVLDIPRGTVKSRAARARAALIEEIER